MTDPTPYQLRVSARARNVYLRMSLERGLEVVVPRRYDIRRIPELLNAKRGWIEKNRRRFAGERAMARPDGSAPETLPSEIHLTAINRTWRVQYLPGTNGDISVREIASDLLCVEGTGTFQATCRVLQLWLIRKAQESFGTWLLQVSGEVEIPFKKMSVRLQRSRWGSCSRRGQISLNARLLFLPPEWVRYLFIHELCHLVQMNHSSRYWAVVAEKEPGYKALDSELRTAMRQVPRWALV